MGGQEEDDKEDLLHTHSPVMSSFLFEWRAGGVCTDRRIHKSTLIHTTKITYICIHVNEYVLLSTHTHTERERTNKCKLNS